MSVGGIFLGRDRELAEVTGLLEAASAGRGGLLFLVGEPGIGKTRLADVACANEAAAAFRVSWGRCWESGGAPAYWPWTQSLSGLLRDASPDELRALVGADGDVLAPILPALAPGGARADPASGEAQEARFQIFRAVVALLGRLSRNGPLLLVFDDLHAADQSSLLLLQFVARELRAMRLLIIGTYRDVEARLSAEAGQLLARAAREARTLALARLGAEEVASYVRRTAGGASDETVSSIFRATQGNPLFLDEVIRGLAGGGGLGVEGGLPFGVREAIRQHLGLLSPETRGLVEVAAVIGQELDPAMVRLAAGASAAAADEALRAAVAAGVLIERGPRLAFSHGLVREALYRDLSAESRRRLHRAVAEVLDRVERRPAEKPWAELTHHYLGAGPDAIARAVSCSIEAAARALDALAYEDAIALLDRARAALELAPPEPRARAELLLAEGLARIRAGEGRRGAELCAWAAELARPLSDPELFARAALGYGTEFTFGKTDPVLVRLLEEALARLPEADSIPRARVLARLASAVQPAIDPSEPVQAARDAIAMARRIGDQPTLLAVIHAGMSAMMDFIPGGERMALNLEGERLATELDDRPKALRARARLFFDHLDVGNLARADQSLAGYEALAHQLRSLRALWLVPLFRSMRAAMEGDFERCDAWVAEAGALAERAGDASRHWVLVFHRFGLYRVQGRHQELAALEPEIRAAFGAAPPAELWMLAFSATIRVALGRLEEAAAVLRSRPIEEVVAAADTSTLGFLAEVAAAIGDRGLAERLSPVLAPLADNLLSYGAVGMFCEGPYHRQLGLMATTLGRHDEAVRHLEAAIATTRALNLRPHLARVLFECAQARRARGDAEGEVRELLAEARALAEGLRLPALVRRIGEAQDAPRAADAPRAVAPKGPAFELRREGDYWTIVAAEAVLRLRDTRGLQILHRLVTNPDQEFHATDLVASTAEGVKDAGDAGEMLDRQAREEYRERVAALEEEVREAQSFADPGRAARAREELDFIAAELSRAVGLGGRDRKAASSAERARVAVQKRLKEALKKIEEGAPVLGQHLAATIRTGTFCAYHPGGRRP